MKRIHLYQVHELRIVDGDTVEAWVDVSSDLRSKWRIRLEGIEGGELGDALGEGAKAHAIAEVLAGGATGAHFIGEEKRRDQHNRRVGDIRLADTSLLTERLLSTGAYWVRTRSGLEHPWTKRTETLQG